jgi:hypothetical protein
MAVFMAKSLLRRFLLGALAVRIQGRGDQPVEEVQFSPRIAGCLADYPRERHWNLLAVGIRHRQFRHHAIASRSSLSRFTVMRAQITIPDAGPP